MAIGSGLKPTSTLLQRAASRGVNHRRIATDRHRL